MIRVLVKASSPMAKAGLESLLRAQPTIQLLGDSYRQETKLSSYRGALPTRGDAARDEPAIDSAPEVWVVEADTLADPAAREAVDWAQAGGPAVLLVRNPAAEPVADALRDGVKAVLSSAIAGTELAAAIEAAAAGLVVLDGADVESLLRAPSVFSGDSAATTVESLTPREIEVLRLLAAGLGNKEIASRLDISDHTVKFHVASIMGKLGAGSRTEAVTIGIRKGLIMI